MTEITATVIPFRKRFYVALVDLIDRYPDTDIDEILAGLEKAATVARKHIRKAKELAAQRQREEDR